jgi:hypothetical protein
MIQKHFGTNIEVVQVNSIWNALPMVEGSHTKKTTTTTKRTWCPKYRQEMKTFYDHVFS